MVKRAKKNQIANRIKKLEKKVNSNQPELKQIELYFNSQNITNSGGSSLPSMNPSKGTNSNQRIGDKIKLVSYYGVFYMRLHETGADTTNSIRMIHCLNENAQATDSPIYNNGGTQMLFNQLPQDQGLIVLEDKLITLSQQGPACRKLVIKKKFKYPVNLKWDTNNEYVGWVPQIYFTSDSSLPSHPVLDGQIRYYYTDA